MTTSDRIRHVVGGIKAAGLVPQLISAKFVAGLGATPTKTGMFELEAASDLAEAQLFLDTTQQGMTVALFVLGDK